jgi:hypothetical protein
MTERGAVILLQFEKEMAIRVHLKIPAFSRICWHFQGNWNNACTVGRLG